MLLSKASKRGVSIPETTKEQLLNWFTTTKSTIYTDQLKQELAAGADLWGFLSAKLKKEDTFRNEIKVTYERRVSELPDTIDRIAAAIQTDTKKEVLVIIDDLDKLDLSVVESIYRDNINALFSPNIRIVFTIPISVVREPRLLATLQSFCQIILLSVTKFYPQDQAHKADGEAIAENVEILQEILDKRIPSDLIDPNVRRQLVLLSGGVLRELIRLGQECCRECMLELELDPNQPDLVINADILAAAVKTLRNQFARSLGSQLYELLVKIYADFTPPDARSSEFLELLHGLYVLEYENDDLWYDLHPLVADLLQRKQLLTLSHLSSVMVMQAKISPLNQRELSKLIISIRANAHHLDLFLAVCDDRELRDLLIQQYETTLANEGFAPYRVGLNPKAPSLKATLDEFVKYNPALQSDTKVVVTVLGSSSLFGVRLTEDKSEQEKFFFSLQWTREALREFKFPVVLWLSNYSGYRGISASPGFLELAQWCV